MYFAVLGKTPEISLAELEYIKPQNIKEVRNNIITFETNFPDQLKTLGGVIKRGRVVDTDEMAKQLQDKKIIGVNDENLGKKLKSEKKIRRYKIIKLFHTDLEIKNKGLEIIQINKEQFGIVEGYQNIRLYEAIDFEKPARSMNMGMMPAKLAHIILNIGLANSPSLTPTIYDPFVGSGTTGFLANHFGYDFIGSDIKIAYVQENKERRFNMSPLIRGEKKGGLFAHKDKKFEIFQHDITLPLKLEKKDALLITEGRLGPMITDKSSHKDIQLSQTKVFSLYKAFIDRIYENRLTAVFTIPYYLGHDNILEAQLQKKIKSYGDNSLTLTAINEVYSRKNQKIGRKILIIK